MCFKGEFTSCETEWMLTWEFVWKPTIFKSVMVSMYLSTSYISPVAYLYLMATTVIFLEQMCGIENIY